MNDFKMNFIKFLKTVSEKAEKLACVPMYVCIRTCVVCLLTNIRGIAELSFPHSPHGLFYFKG